MTSPRWIASRCMAVALMMASSTVVPASAQPATPSTSDASIAPAASEEPGTVAPDAAQDSQAQYEAELASSELAEILSETPDQEVSLELYGFADFGVALNLTDEDSPWNATNDTNRSFYLGNLNVYLDAYMFDVARSLIEVRFSYLPQNEFDSQGNRLGVGSDYADRSRPLRYGSIEIERAWVEYNLHNLLTVRIGSYLTPYGIWNVDHGTPTVIPATRPYIIGQALLPERQTGFQLHGTAALGDRLRGTYHLTLSNGRGPLDAFADLDRNKAIGGRVALKLDAFGTWSLGASTYFGRYTDARPVSTGLGSLSQLRIVNQYDELSLAADLQWDYEALHVQWELVHNQTRYTDEGRVAGAGALGPISDVGGLALFPADSASWGTYALIAYRLPWANLMPYVYTEYYDWQSVVNELVVFVGGLNWRPIPTLVFKLQYLHALDADPATFSIGNAEDLKTVQFQTAWSF